MSVPSSATGRMVQRLMDLQTQGKFQNFVAQAHSRDILRYLRVSPEDWPAYTATLDDDLNYTAHFLLYQGLELKGGPNTSTQGDENLTLGAEILEYVHTKAGPYDPERACQIFTAALAYYIAGHFARAYVLIRDLESTAPLPAYLRTLRHLLLKDTGGLRSEIFSILLNPEYSDARISERIVAGEIDEDEATSLILEGTLCRALSYFLEHVKTGVLRLLNTASELLENGIEVAIHNRFVDWWWFLSCVRALLRSYEAHSFWNHLSPYFQDRTSRVLATRYIRGNYKRPTPIIELWPSQVTAVPLIVGGGENQKNLCLRMPTSAGKTKIAELAILNLLASHPTAEAKCIYIAPFRSLAVEIEQALKQAFIPLGVRVSEIYGGFELTLSEKLLIDNTQILIATPEKMDALLRFNPELASQIMLIILDEGHIISPPNFQWIRRSRGLKYEVFLQRLLNRYEKSNTRIVFLSAVMPNADQFAEWITGDPQSMVQSLWRPSRLMLGEATWTGSGVDLDFTHSDHRPLDHRCFVRGFVRQIAREDLPDKRRKSPFPADGSEALALTALEFARKSMTMIFVARKASAEPLGRTVLSCIRLQRRLAGEGGSYSLPVDPNIRGQLEHCVKLIRDTVGSDSPLAEFLAEGFVVHHGDLPHVLRIEFEKLVRNGGLRLVIATTTLAQGVNFPVHTVLVHSLDHGQRELVSPMNFWNICGRAGRGMKENEGQVLFFVPNCFEEWQNASHRKWLQRFSSAGQEMKWQEWRKEQAQIRQQYIQSYGSYTVTSALLLVVKKICGLWKEKHGNINVAELCESLANHTLDLFAPSEEVDFESLLSSLDSLLIALTEERELEEITPDDFQEILHRSLLHLQLPNDADRRTVHLIFHARLRYIRSKYPDRADRRRLYQLGLPLRDCEQIEGARENLLAIYLLASDYDTWSPQERGEHLGRIAEFLLSLSEITPDRELPDCWRQILVLWLSGATPNEMVGDPEISQFTKSPSEVSRVIDDLCGYRLPWGFNSLGIYLQTLAEMQGKTLPEICGSYSSLVKYGVHDPVACWLLTFGVSSRRIAVRVAELIGGRFLSPDALLVWLLAGGITELRDLGLGEDDVQVIQGALHGLDFDPKKLTRARTIVSVKATSATPNASTLKEGDRLLIRPNPPTSDRHFSLFTLMGEFLGNYECFHEGLAAVWNHPEQLDVCTFADFSEQKDTERASSGGEGEGGSSYP